MEENRGISESHSTPQLNHNWESKEKLSKHAKMYAWLRYSNLRLSFTRNAHYATRAMCCGQPVAMAGQPIATLCKQSLARFSISPQICIRKLAV